MPLGQLPNLETDSEKLASFQLDAGDISNPGEWPDPIPENITPLIGSVSKILSNKSRGAGGVGWEGGIPGLAPPRVMHSS